MKPRVLLKNLSIFLGAMLLLSLLYLGVVLNLPYSADDAVPMVMAKAVIDGNVLMKGWTLTSHSSFTTGLPAYVLGILIFGFSSKVIYIMTALQWALMALLVIYASATLEGGGTVLSRVVISVCLTFYFFAFLRQIGLVSAGEHLVPYSYCLICLLMVQRIDQDDKWIYYALFCVFLVLALVGDPFSLFVMGVPVIVVCLVKIVMWGPKRKAVALLFVAIGSILISTGFLRLITALGGPRVLDLPANFADLPTLGKNVVLLTQGILDLFSVQLLGAPVMSYESLIGIIRLSGLGIFVLVLFFTVRKIQQQTWTVQVIIAIVAVNILSFTSSTTPVDQTSVRYLLPALIFSTILVSGSVAESVWFKERRGLTIVYFVILAACLMPGLARSRPRMPIEDLGSFLIEKHLTIGYGPYWSANNITVSTLGEAAVRPVVSVDGKTIRPLPLASDQAWYELPADFVVIDTKDSTPLSISREQALNTFGSPSIEYDLGRYMVLVWGHAISFTSASHIPNPLKL